MPTRTLIAIEISLVVVATAVLYLALGVSGSGDTVSGFARQRSGDRHGWLGASPAGACLYRAPAAVGKSGSRRCLRSTGHR